MKISALNMSFSALAFGLALAHFEPAAYPVQTAYAGKEHEPGREVIERLGPHEQGLLKDLEQLEQHVESKGFLTIEEYQEIQSQLDELLQRVNDEAKTSGQADAKLFGEVLELQEVVIGIDVR